MSSSTALVAGAVEYFQYLLQACLPWMSLRSVSLVTYVVRGMSSSAILVSSSPMLCIIVIESAKPPISRMKQRARDREYLLVHAHLQRGFAIDEQKKDQHSVKASSAAPTMMYVTGSAFIDECIRVAVFVRGRGCVQRRGGHVSCTYRSIWCVFSSWCVSFVFHGTE